MKALRLFLLSEILAADCIEYHKINFPLFLYAYACLHAAWSSLGNNYGIDS